MAYSAFFFFSFFDLISHKWATNHNPFETFYIEYREF